MRRKKKTEKERKQAAAERQHKGKPLTLPQMAQKLERIAMTVREELKCLDEHQSCIFASAVLIEVLRQRGYPTAYPLTVRVKIFNPSLTIKMKQVVLPPDAATFSKWIEKYGPPIYVGGGESPGPGQWAGHLAVVVPKALGAHHALCDITITQANKPDLGVDLPPICLLVSDAFVKGEVEFKATTNGCWIVYKPFPDDESYKGASNWMNKERQKQVVDRVMAALKGI